MTQLMTEQGMVRVPAGTWVVDPAHSSVAFEVKHMMISTVRGQFREFDGTLEAAEDDPADSRVRGMLDRKDFGLSWQQPLAKGGVLVGEEVKILIDVSAVRAS